MKASRLLQLLLLLQTRQRMTTPELAERLEVSARTVLRDVEALSAAGVPVYAERGRHGGIVLLPSARLNLSQLDAPELDALAVVGLDARAVKALGLDDAHDVVARKVDARLAASPVATEGPRLGDVVLVDNSGWLAGETDEVDVAELALTVRRRVRLRLTYRRSGETEGAEKVVDPYGLVAKAGRWYLVADVDGVGRMFSLARMTGFAALDDAARLRSDVTLRTAWDELKAGTEELGDVVVTARLRPSRLDLARRILGARLVGVEASETDEWPTISVRCREVEGVRQLLQFGDHIEVIAPDAARERVRELAGTLAANHE